MGNQFFLLIGIISVFVNVGDCLLFGSVWDLLTGKGPNFNLTRTCFNVPKNLHQTILSNDCELVNNNPTMPINKLTKANHADTLINPFRGNINLNWLVGAPYNSPYTKKKTNPRFSFEIAYEDDPLKNKIINPVEPHLKYNKDPERKFAKELTAILVASKADPPIKPAKVVIKKNVISKMKPPKFLRCGKPVSFKIRFYTQEVPNFRNLDYMYLIYKGIIRGC